MKKRLSTTVDFFDDVMWSKREYTPRNVDELLSFVRSIGVEHVNWHWDTWWGYYRRPFGGERNALAYAASKAADLGMELHAVVKPFEAGMAMPLPHAFPKPEGVPVIDDLRGLTWRVDPFAAANPHFRFKRKPGDWSGKGVIETINLVKADATPARIRPDDLEIWVGEMNGELARLDRAFDLSEQVEWRADFPVGGERTVVTLSGLGIEDRWRYVFVKWACDPEAVGFGNGLRQVMEIYDAEGNLLPSTPAGRKLSETSGLEAFPYNVYNDYAASPEVRAFLEDGDKVRAAFADFYSYERHGDNPWRSLDGDGYAGVCRGKNPYMGGALNPAHPEVRDYWLSIVRDCVECGVHGVNFRVASHSCTSDERDEYGFNEPSLEMRGGRADRDAANRRNGEAYTEFLLRAKELLNERGLPAAVHVNAVFVHPDDRGKFHFWGKIPPNCEWPWERWIREVADVVYLKDMHFLFLPHAEHFIDKVARVAGECGKPLVYVSTNKEVRFSGDLSKVAWEMDCVLRDDRIAGYDLYETANYTQRNADGRIEGSPEMARLVKAKLG